MTRGGNSSRRALAALAAILVAAVLPGAAAAAPQEYDLALPGAGSGGGSESGSASSSSTAPAVTPTAPTVTAPTSADGTPVGSGGNGKKNRQKRDRAVEPQDPVLTTSGVNATAGPQEIPPLKVDDDEGGVPTLALVLALLAAASCILALWRLRFLRELPAAPRPPTPRPEASS